MDEALRPLAGAWVAAPNRAVKSGATGWDLLLVTVAVYVATAVGRVHQLFPMLLPLKPAMVSALLAILLLVLQQSGQRRLGLLRSATTSCLLGLLVWGALSVPGALNQGIAFQTWTDLVRSVGMGLVVAASIRAVRDIERVTLVYFGVTVVYTAVVLSRFQLGADSWRLAGLYYYDANDFATLITTAMPLGLYFVIARQRPLLRVLATLGLAILAVGLIKSGSRGGFLALLAVTAFVLLAFTSVPARTRAVALVIILVVAGTTASDKYWAQMQTIIHPDQDYNSTSDAGRLKIWKRGLGYMADYPVLGVGIGNFPTAEGTISPLAKRQERGLGVRWGAAHNSFVQVGAELGVPGVLLFVGVIVTVFRSLRRVARRRAQAGRAPDEVARLAQGLMAALVGFVVGAFFLSLGYADMLCVLVGLAVAFVKTARDDAARSQPQPRTVAI